ncbi:hypothetical protein AA313_de0204895 [Arthrobotrys entomopaga]|nr:hypothetical protein AA313_de0204895 [Arthrobotrys entomopaga]
MAPRKPKTTVDPSKPTPRKRAAPRKTKPSEPSKASKESEPSKSSKVIKSTSSKPKPSETQKIDKGGTTLKAEKTAKTAAKKTKVTKVHRLSKDSKISKPRKSSCQSNRSHARTGSKDPIIPLFLEHLDSTRVPNIWHLACETDANSKKDAREPLQNTVKIAENPNESDTTDPSDFFFDIEGVKRTKTSKWGSRKRWNSLAPASKAWVRHLLETFPHAGNHDLMEHLIDTKDLFKQTINFQYDVWIDYFIKIDNQVTGGFIQKIGWFGVFTNPDRMLTVNGEAFKTPLVQFWNHLSASIAIEDGLATVITRPGGTEKHLVYHPSAYDTQAIWNKHHYWSEPECGEDFVRIGLPDDEEFEELRKRYWLQFSVAMDHFVVDSTFRVEIHAAHGYAHMLNIALHGPRDEDHSHDQQWWK